MLTGANIDMGHHLNRARYALEEGLAFDSAVKKVIDMTSSDDTLVVVSADHSHPFTIGGEYPYATASTSKYYPYTEISDFQPLNERSQS